jgi:hypothetical protein
MSLPFGEIGFKLSAVFGGMGEGHASWGCIPHLCDSFNSDILYYYSCDNRDIMAATDFNSA